MGKVIAIDFDGTLFEYKWPEIGSPIWNVINWCKSRKIDYNDTLILWTCRTGDKLNEAIKACEEVGLIFDYINENCPQMKELYSNDARKIGADIYIDDRAINVLDVTQLRLE